MPIRFNCPKCQQVVDVSTSQAGEEVSCPECGERIAVPKAKPEVADPLADLVAALTSKGEEKPSSKDQKAGPGVARETAKQPQPTAKPAPQAAQAPAARSAQAQQKPAAGEAREIDEAAAHLAELAGASPAQPQEKHAAQPARPAEKPAARPAQPQQRPWARPVQPPVRSPARRLAKVAGTGPSAPVREAGVRVVEAVEELAAQAAQTAAPRVSRGAAWPAEGSAAFGAATLVLLAAAIALIFTPWLDVLLMRIKPVPLPAGPGRVVRTYKDLDLIRLKVSPVSFVVNMGKMTDAFEGRDSSSEQKEGQAGQEKAAARSQVSGAASAMLVAFPFVYGAGLVVAVVGAFQILGRWRSVVASFGFAICIIGCLLAVIAWQTVSTASAVATEATTGIVDLALTPWFYAAMLAGLLGLVTSILAITRRPRRYRD